MTRIAIMRLLETYFRHRWLYLLPIVLMTALGIAYVLTAKPTYQAQGVMYVRTENLLSTLNAVVNNDSSWWLTPAQVVSGELNEIIQTDAYVRSIIRDTSLEAHMAEGPVAVEAILDQTRNSIWAYAVGNNQVVVTAVDPDPVIAYQLVGAALEGYVQWQINAQRSESESARVFFADLIVRYGSELEAARDEMRDYLSLHPEPIRGDRPSAEQVDLQRLQSGIDLAGARYASALSKEEDAQLSLAQIESDARQNYMLIDAPVLPREADVSLKDMAVKMAIFVGVGLIAFAVAVAGAAVLDRTFRFPVDVEVRLNLPVVAALPDTTPRRRFARLRRNSEVREPVEVAESGERKSPKEKAELSGGLLEPTA